MTETYKLGYEFGTGEEVKIPLGHTVWTGITQLSGKTTGIESFGMRTGKRVIAFITKPGEESFQDSTKIKPFFRERADWEFIKGLIESMMKYRIRGQEQAKIIQLTREGGGNSLSEFKKKLDEKLASSRSGYNLDIYTNLHAYLEKIIPRVYDMEYSRELELVDGINVIDLEKFSLDVEIQGLIIASVLDEVQSKYTDTIIAIPEFWKFAPQERGSPCKQSITSFAKQGAAKRNFLFFDCQELASTDKEPLKQCSNWVMGYQTERNEVKHTIDQLPIPKKKKPDQDMIQNLRTGEFYVTMKGEIKKIFVQAWWVTDSDARDVALGRKTMKDLPKRPMKNYKKPEVKPEPSVEFSESKHVDEMIAIPEELEKMRRYFETENKKAMSEIANLNNRVTELNRKFGDVMVQIQQNQKPVYDIDDIIQKVVAKMPGSAGSIIIHVNPIEKLQKDFLEQTKSSILEDVSRLGKDAKKLMKYLESKEGKGIKMKEVLENCFHITAQGANYAKPKEVIKELERVSFGRYDSSHLVFYGELKQRVSSLLAIHNATESEINSVYQHIIFEMCSD